MDSGVIIPPEAATTPASPKTPATTLNAATNLVPTPDLIAGPDAAAGPDLISTRALAATPDPAATPDLIAGPDAAATPSLAATPDLAATPALVTTPDLATTPGPTATPALAATPDLAAIAAKVARGERISTPDARWLWLNAADADLKALATQVRARFHSPQACSYMVMRIINYTNVCVAQCDYCAFYRLPGQPGGYVMAHDEVFAKLDQLLALGGDLAAFNGGFNPALPLAYYCDLFAAIRARYGDAIEFYALTIAEFMYLADHAKIPFAEAAQRLKAAGVRWITGGGSEILTESFRARHSKFKYTVQAYFQAQQAIIEAGLKTTATMVIGFDETLDERLEHMDRTRTFQDQTHGLASFLCWTFKPYFTQIGGIEITTAEYLRHLALCRIYFDNIPRIRTSVLTQNQRALEGLLYGADDFDLPIEDEVTQKAGATISLDFEKILAYAHQLGFTPTYRHVTPHP